MLLLQFVCSLYKQRQGLFRHCRQTVSVWRNCRNEHKEEDEIVPLYRKFNTNWHSVFEKTLNMLIGLRAERLTNYTGKI